MSFSKHIAAQTVRVARYRDDAGVAILRDRFSAAEQQANAWDTLGEYGITPPLTGLTLAVKACFDVQGWPTTAGSAVLAHTSPATRSAPLVDALNRLGAVVTTQTNMTEFAFGALGLNPHLGTPGTPLDPTGQRIAGGSTSGGAVAVALGLADIALGSDTSGSIRIPAAFCGVVGFKPTQGRYSDKGMIFLSPTFDVPGFVARDVETLVRVDHALVPDGQTNFDLPSLRGRRFFVPTRFALEHADTVVITSFQAALERLKHQGAEVIEGEWSELADFGEVAMEGGIIIAEAFTQHRALLQTSAHLYDPRVGPRIALGERVTASGYLKARQTLALCKVDYGNRLSNYDALLTPTVPFIPPTLAELEDDSTYYQKNRLAFRLTEIANRIDAPSVSLPAATSEAIGICLTGHRGGDRQLLHLAQAVQAALHPLPI